MALRPLSNTIREVLKPVVVILMTFTVQPVFSQEELPLGMQSPKYPVQPPGQQPAFLPSMGCMIQPSMRIDISSPVTGVVDKLTVKLGDKVKRGSSLFTLNNRVEIASVELAKVRAEFAQRKVKRNENLYKDNLISAHERDEFITEKQVALKELRHARAVLELRTIKSPINGIVVDRFSDPGEFVGTDPLLTLASLDPLRVELLMPYDRFGSIPPDATLLIYPEAPVNGLYQAKVTLVDPIIDAASSTFRVRAELPNPEGKLPAGLKCRAELKP